MEGFEIHGKEQKNFPGGQRFGWIAYDAIEVTQRVLFDSHPPKGTHFHIDLDKEGIAFEWKTQEEAENFFFQKVVEKFGELFPVSNKK